MNTALTRAAMAAAALALATPVAAQNHSDNNAPPAGKQANGRIEREADPVLAVRDSDAAMNAAMAEARATLPQWIALYRDPPPGYTNFAIKYPLEGVEHIWVAVESIEDGVFVGRLANAPHAEGWSFGDPVRVPMAEVSDWAYWDDKGVAHGYRTVVVLFDMMPPEQVAAIRAQFGWE